MQVIYITLLPSLSQICVLFQSCARNAISFDLLEVYVNSRRQFLILCPGIIVVNRTPVSDPLLTRSAVLIDTLLYTSKTTSNLSLPSPFLIRKEIDG